MGLVKMYDYFDSVRAVCSNGVLVDDVCRVVLAHNKWRNEFLGEVDYGSRLSDVMCYYCELGDHVDFMSYVFGSSSLTDAVSICSSFSRLLVYWKCDLVDFSIFDELI